MKGWDNMDELVPAFESSLFETSITDLGIEFAELGIDSILSDGVLKDIPIVGTIVGVGKLAHNVHDRNLLRQTLTFIKEFNRSSINSGKIEKYRKKLHDSPQKLEEELGRVLILLDQNVDTIKSTFEARFYVAYVDEKISWDTFCELCDITDRLFISDIANLREAYENKGVTINAGISYKHDRLNSVGLLESDTRITGGLVFVDIEEEKKRTYMKLTIIGELFCKIAFDL